MKAIPKHKHYDALTRKLSQNIDRAFTLFTLSKFFENFFERKKERN